MVCCATDEDCATYEPELKLPEDGGSKKLDEGWIWCCRGECSGEPLDSEDRSEPAEWMDCSCRSVSMCREGANHSLTQSLNKRKLTSSSVSKWNGQNISSSSMSNDRAASNSLRKFCSIADSIAASFFNCMARICFCSLRWW